ncbi:MAG: transcription repressor NadR [Firmicutes bacterium]|nr:transcription repressor NadR [Bacillota bacterium]
MQAEERRKKLLDKLSSSKQPMTGSELAAACGVSRQVIVQDIAILRAAGEAIVATPQGYRLLIPAMRLRHEAVLAVRHTPEQTETELLALVSAGVEVANVIVEHPLYGELTGMLALDSADAVQQWYRQMRDSGSHLLSELTDGLHLHTVYAATPEAIERARQAMRALRFLVEDP